MSFHEEDTLIFNKEHEDRDNWPELQVRIIEQYIEEYDDEDDEPCWLVSIEDGFDELERYGTDMLAVYDDVAMTFVTSNEFLSAGEYTNSTICSVNIDDFV